MGDSSDDFDSSSEGEMLNMTSLAQILPTVTNGPVKQGGCGVPGQEKLEEEVAEARAKLERAKGNREQLTLFYARKERELNTGPEGEQATMEQYLELKEKYFGLVLEAGEQEQELKDIEADLTVATNGVARLQRELYKLEGPKENSSPWQVGVPYGSGMAGRS